MKALDTALQLTASAGLTGALFALPFGLAMLWQTVPDLPEAEVVAAPMVALAAMPLSIAPSEGLGDLAGDQGEGEVGGGTDSAGASAPLLQPTERTEGPMRATRSRTRSTPATPAQAPTKGKKNARKCLPGNEGIARVEADLWEVERDIVDAYAKKPATLGDLGWAAVHEGADGKNDGFKIGGITCGNDLHEAGLRNGDVVHAVNGKPVRTIPEAIWAYTTQRKAEVIELRITRKGQERVLVYRMG